ncbi:pyridoxine/pyridoxamine 5'-phosphate oxidase [Aeromicrobium flavum]|uniref:Pyridoxine/pyridoxamine 5'-phosphate oxidase n=1 Tax=Aeromicrobium flavum TaxID=416568 RepID=A0A512HTB3_9ACTN|nr:pyridoxamine 5'-phosphate oxidase [Aeromicrobium flavum]GEO88687.1 pyridoxine/pyridoxamine 5'-phosphate oxidase [Aeromicrobium flavum]
MVNEDLARMRTEYARAGLDESAAGDDPIALAQVWLAEAIAAGVHEPNAMAVATATPAGEPSVRIVLLKGLDDAGAVFFTNYASRKGRELAENPRAAAVMLWHPLHRQLRLEGAVERLDPQESDAYFLARPEGARISAAASPQSQVVAGRDELERRWQEAEAAGAAGERPAGWGGYRIAPEVVEFWHGRENRLHDRIRFTRSDAGWSRDRLAP